MTTYQWLSLFGVPTIILSLIMHISSKLKKERIELRERDAASRAALQALLRAQMINDYNKWNDRGYAPIYARENFENCWVQYHALGANGVMDNIRSLFLALPTEPPEVKNE